VIDIAVPYDLDARGRTATATAADHLRQMLEVLLFTSPGERVNRPEFGGGLRPLVFDPNSAELAAALRFNLQANLQRWMGDLLDLQDLAVANDDAALRVDIAYVVRRTGEIRTAQFNRAV
jgi:phage baseplate assembly protein W